MAKTITLTVNCDTCEFLKHVGKKLWCYEGQYPKKLTRAGRQVNCQKKARYIKA